MKSKMTVCVSGFLSWRAKAYRMRTTTLAVLLLISLTATALAPPAASEDTGAGSLR